jgi:molybdenum cofactor cytidylyltransferase
MNPFTCTSAIILSAGYSERMGGHKALLRYRKGSTFLQQIAETYEQTGIEQIIVVVNGLLYKRIKELKLNLPDHVELVINEKPEVGRFFSLQTGLKHLQPGNSCFFQNIDNPFTSAEVLTAMIKNKMWAGVVIPVYQGKSGHPVLFNSFVAQKIISSGNVDSRIDEFLKEFKIIRVDISDANVLANINSQEELRKAGLGI